MTKIYAYRNNTSVEIINSTAKPSASCREKKKLKYTILQLLMRGIVFALCKVTALRIEVNY